MPCARRRKGNENNFNGGKPQFYVFSPQLFSKIRLPVSPVFCALFHNDLRALYGFHTLVLMSVTFSLYFTAMFCVCCIDYEITSPLAHLTHTNFM